MPREPSPLQRSPSSVSVQVHIILVFIAFSCACTSRSKKKTIQQDNQRKQTEDNVQRIHKPPATASTEAMNQLFLNTTHIPGHPNTNLTSSCILSTFLFFSFPPYLIFAHGLERWTELVHRAGVPLEHLAFGVLKLRRVKLLVPAQHRLRLFLGYFDLHVVKTKVRTKQAAAT